MIAPEVGKKIIIKYPAQNVLNKYETRIGIITHVDDIEIKAKVGKTELTIGVDKLYQKGSKMYYDSYFAPKATDSVLNSIIKYFKSQPKKTLTAKDFDKFPSAYLMDNWDKIKKMLEQHGFQIKATTKVAMEITADMAANSGLQLGEHVFVYKGNNEIARGNLDAESNNSFVVNNKKYDKAIYSFDGASLASSRWKPTKIAMEITAGRIQPIVESTIRTVIILRKDDFKDSGMFHGIMEQLGLHDALHKALAGIDTGDEPVTTHDDYDEIEMTVVKSKMQ